LFAHRSASIAAFTVGFAAYFFLLIHQVSTFDGSFQMPDFLTAATVIPWCIYILAGPFAAPLVVQDIVSRASTAPEGNGPAVLTTLLLAVWTALPYVVVQVASFYERSATK
jgi:hypothetical protein